MPENESSKLNPQVIDIEIGIRKLRKITIYPLSMSDQLSLTDTVIKTIMKRVEDTGSADVTVAFIIEVIQDNIGKILKMVTDETDDLTLEMSNMQAVDVANVIFDVNYGAVAKNFKSLSAKIKEMFQSERPLQQSAKGTDIVSKTSTESPIEKAV